MSTREKILVHTCCAACACYVLPRLSHRFEVTAFFFNPNIHPRQEYRHRLRETAELCRNLNIPLTRGDYSADLWWEVIEPYRDLPERSRRCWSCYRLRLEQTALRARQLNIPAFTTTLSVSPHKVYTKIAGEGRAAGEEYGVEFLEEDFKKRDGFKISVQRSRELGITRQDYCGCLLSLREAEQRRNPG